MRRVKVGLATAALCIAFAGGIADAANPVSARPAGADGVRVIVDQSPGARCRMVILHRGKTLARGSVRLNERGRGGRTLGVRRSRLGGTTLVVRVRCNVDGRTTLLVARLRLPRRPGVVVPGSGGAAGGGAGQPGRAGPAPEATTPVPTPEGARPPTPASSRSRLLAGESLGAAQQLTSPDGRYRLVMQGDGNLVQYGPGGQAIWSSGTQGSGHTVVMQADGNLVVYAPGGVSRWQSATGGRSGSFRLELQDDSNLVIYGPAGAAWTRNSTLGASQGLGAGQSLTSPNGRYRLAMQGDGNLVVYEGGSALWSTATQGAGHVSIMQGDGNLVVYAPGGVPRWQAGTGGRPNAPFTLWMQDDGNLVVYGPGGVVWTRDRSGVPSPGGYGPPTWFPLRRAANSGPFKVSCVFSNCPGPYHGYWAIDFSDPSGQPGAPVYAAGPGRVITAVGSNSRCGGPGTPSNFVAVDHGAGVVTRYLHLSTVTVGQGQWVNQGVQVGAIGSVGYTDPCPAYHLHFEVIRGGQTQDPGPLLACHRISRVSYPGAAGFASWNSIPFLGAQVFSDGVNCS